MMMRLSASAWTITSPMVLVESGMIVIVIGNTDADRNITQVISRIIQHPGRNTKVNHVCAGNDDGKADQRADGSDDCGGDKHADDAADDQQDTASLATRLC